MKNFKLTFELNDGKLITDYHDGSDIESTAVTSQSDLESTVLDHVRTALSEEDD